MKIDETSGIAERQLSNATEQTNSSLSLFEIVEKESHHSAIVQEQTRESLKFMASSLSSAFIATTIIIFLLLIKNQFLLLSLRIIVQRV
jgi:hypothetical protein